MIDIEGLPAPDDAPEVGKCVRIERPEPGLVVLVLDPPHRKAVVLDMPLMRDLDLALEELERDGGVRGIVITGKEPLHFAFGADLDALESVTDPRLVERVVDVGHQAFGRLSRMRALTVAAIGGPVPGGACELALACDRIVLANSPKSKIGLPETQLGIIPAWGGAHRLPRRVGIVAGLEAILKGRLFDARRAKKMGLVDRLTEPEFLARIAADVALGRDRSKRASRGWKKWLVDKNPLAAAIVTRQARKTVMAQTRGKYPAVLEMVEIVPRAPRVSMKDAARIEAAIASRVATGPVAKSLIGIFRASEAAKKLGRTPDGKRPRPIEHGAVIGAGVMGGAIASVMAERGVATRLGDLDAATLSRSLAEHQKEIEKKRKRRRLEPHLADAALDRLDGTTAPIAEGGYARAQIVIEAVAERLDVKRAVFGELAKVVAHDALLATNTSSLSVAEIAEGLPHPERVVGLHFFNPVRKMPLVEVVRGPATSDEAVASAAALALALGKTPVIVKDVAGFLVNRVLGPYLDEALRLFDAGVEPEKLDRALLEFGMPMGPLRLLDEVGFDIAKHAAASLFEAYGERMTPCNVLDSFVDTGRLGRKTGKGFYVHDGKSKEPALADDLGARRSSTRLAGMTEAEIAERCVLAMGNEALRCLDEGVVAGKAELDLASVFGTGFAPFRGGLARYLDSIGEQELVRRLKAIGAAPDVKERKGKGRFEVREKRSEVGSGAGS